jgi:hypothetical protein
MIPLVNHDFQVSVAGFGRYNLSRCIYPIIPNAPWCWNIYQHFPKKSSSFVGKYTIHGADGINNMNIMAISRLIVVMCYPISADGDLETAEVFGENGVRILS